MLCTKLHSPFLITLLVIGCTAKAANLPEAPAQSSQLSSLDSKFNGAVPRVLCGAFNIATMSCLVAGAAKGGQEMYKGNIGAGCLKMAGGLGAAAVSHTVKGIVTETDFKQTISAIMVNFDIARIITACSEAYKTYRETQRTEQLPGEGSRR